MTPPSIQTRPRLTIGTRGSPLALAQAREVRDRLAAAHADLAAPDAVAIAVIKTTGDRVQDRTLAEIGGKGLFTKEIEEALIDGRIDLAVHSMKDVPTWLPAGLEIAAILPREDVRDAWFARGGAGLDDLPAGAVVGTASLRRQAQVLARRPDLACVPFRGNVATRLAKLEAGEVDATLLAVAGLKRLGRADLVTAPLDPATMLPAVAQGAIGVEIRSADTRTRNLVAALNDRESAIRVTAERAFLAVLDGNCRTPIAALADVEGDRLHFRGQVAAPDGSAVERCTGEGPIGEAERIGREAGEAVLDRARALLARD
ncbi:MAG: hydroxymethylbilane synthase [Azospirillaceae bacterium]